MAARDGAQLQEEVVELGWDVPCAECLDHDEQAKLLPCGHYYCVACIEKLAAEHAQPIECPKCRRCTTPLTVEEIDSSSFVGKTEDSHGKLGEAEGREVETGGGSFCEQCGEGKAVAFCRRCTQFICEDCARSHQKMKLFADHEVTTLADPKGGGGGGTSLNGAPLPKCPEHATDMCFFCFDCKQLVCRDCVISTHQEHGFDLVEKCAAERREKLGECLTPLRNIKANIDNAEKTISAEKNLVSSKNEAVCSTIRQSFDKLKAVLDQRKMELVKKANQLAEEKLDALTEQISKLKMAKNEIESVVEFVEQHIDSTSDQNLLSICSELHIKMEDGEKRHREMRLTPTTAADVVCEPPYLDAIPDKLGSVFTRSRASQLRVDPPPESVFAMATKFVMEVPREMGSSVQVQLKSVVEPNCVVEGAVVGTGAVGEVNDAYAVTYTPRVRGRHCLVVKVDGVDIVGSPFPVHVNIHPTQLRNPVRVLGGFDKPWGIAVNNKQQLVVAETGGRKVTVLETNGKRVKEITHHELLSPLGVATSPDGAVYVTDEEAKCLFGFDQDGNLRFKSQKCFKTPCYVKFIKGRLYISDKQRRKIVIVDMQCNILGSIDVHKTMTGSFYPKDITEHGGELYVASDGTGSIGVYQCKSGGKLLRQVPINVNGWVLSHNRGIGFDKSGYAFLVTQEQSVGGVYVLNSSGKFVSSFGLKRFGLLQDPAGLVFDNDGFVYVCDNKGKVYVF